MRLRCVVRLILVLTVVMLGALPLSAQGSYKVEPLGPPPSEVPQALRDALQPTGARLANDQGATVAEIWLLKSVSTQPGGAPSATVIYPGLSTGTMLGALHYPSGGSDFRGQPIKAGFYTLRYAQIPQDGNHMGVSTYRDFLLLGPVTQDTQIDRPLTFDEMVKLSRMASGTGHPAILSLGPASESKAVPAAFQDDQGHWVLQVQVPGAQGFSMGIILVGKTEAG